MRGDRRRRQARGNQCALVGWPDRIEADDGVRIGEEPVDEGCAEVGPPGVEGFAREAHRDEPAPAVVVQGNQQAIELGHVIA